MTTLYLNCRFFLRKRVIAAIGNIAPDLCDFLKSFFFRNVKIQNT